MSSDNYYLTHPHYKTASEEEAQIYYSRSKLYKGCFLFVAWSVIIIIIVLAVLGIIPMWGIAFIVIPLGLSGAVDKLFQPLYPTNIQNDIIAMDKYYEGWDLKDEPYHVSGMINPNPNPTSNMSELYKLQEYYNTANTSTT